MSRRRWHPSADTRSEIIETAERMFESRGFAKTTVADIAAELGMSSANVFKNFNSKIGLLDGIADRQLTRIEASLDALPRDRSAAERLRAIVDLLCREHMAKITTQPQIFEILTATLFELPPSVRRFQQRMRGRVLDLVRGGIASGEFANKNPEDSTDCALEALIVVLDPLILLRRLRAEPDLDIQQRCDSLVDFVVAALRMPLVK